MRLRFASTVAPLLTLLLGFVPATHACAQSAPEANAQMQVLPQPAMPVPAPQTGPAAVQNGPATASAGQTGSGPGPDDIICKKTPPKTGSRLGGGSECHTRRDWERQQAEAQRILSKAQRIGLQGVIY